MDILRSSLDDNPEFAQKVENSIDKPAEEFYNLTQDEFYMSIYTLAEWQRFIKSVEVSVKNNVIHMTGPKHELSKELTLLVSMSGNYTILSDYPEFFIKNNNREKIDICISECYSLNGKEIIKIE